MNSESINIKKENSNSLLQIIGISLLVIIQFLLVKNFESASIFLIGGINIATVFFIFVFNKLDKLIYALILLNILPLLYLNNGFHYAFSYGVMLDSSLFLLAFTALIITIKNITKIKISFTNIETPMFWFLIYALFMAFWGVINGNDKHWIVVELYHFLYFIFFFVILYLFKSREQYIFVFKALLVIFFIIALEYIIYNLFLTNRRFVTFQSGFLPLFAGIVFAYMLLIRDKTKKYISLFILIVFLLGLVITLTRTLWVASFITLFVVYFAYHIYVKKRSVKPLLPMFAVMLLLPFLLIGDSKHAKTSTTAAEMNSVEYRTKSVADPTSDMSFLMRIELGYYAFQKFVSNPLVGRGFGDFLKYKILVVNKAPTYYMDNSWLYMLWKGGTIAGIIFILLFYKIIISLLFILRNTNVLIVKIISIGLLGGVIGLIALSLLSPILIKYRTNFLLAFLYAYIQFEYLKTKEYING